MRLALAMEELLAPIEADAPAGSDLRYTSCYEEIMEARRSDDAVALGDWCHSAKAPDWVRVIDLCLGTLNEKSKDLQIAAWLTEALAVAHGFAGLHFGLRVLAGLTDRFWDDVYPLAEEGDLEYRAAPLEFLDAAVSRRARGVPLTDGKTAPWCCWLSWQQSREAGYEAETRDRYGEVDEEKKRRRDERLADGAPAPEEVDAAVARCDAAFSRDLLSDVERCREAFEVLQLVVGKRFGPAAPPLALLEGALSDCTSLVRRLYGGVAARPDPEPDRGELVVKPAPPVAAAAQQAPKAVVAPDPGEASPQAALAAQARALFEEGNLQHALALLVAAGNGAESVRDKSRIRLLTVELCLEAGRADLARPIVEELHGVIEELKLERWESPAWIAEVLAAYHRCLLAGEPDGDDVGLSRTLLRRICSLDVTKAMPYRP